MRRKSDGRTCTMANSRYDISVIIPVYNVEDYIRPCLDSVLRQGPVSLQVIMIDDGSTDSSGRIADEYAAQYDNFMCRHIENGGQGNARNVGVTLAAGKYIVFLDSDDILPDDSYYRMFRIAERDGSDITICNMARFNSQRIYRSRLHEKVFAHLGSTAHITADHSLLYDTCSPNKLIRRSFYQENGFLCPSGYYYEDIPFCIQMHLAAEKVSVLHDIGYLWREREGSDKSVTQKTAEVRNLRDRITAMEVTNEHLANYSAREDLLASWKYKNLVTDFMIFCNLCTELSDDVLLEMIGLITDYTGRHMQDSDFSVLSPVLQKKYEAVLSRDTGLLRRLREFERSEEYSSMTVHEEGGRLTAHLPEELFGTQAYDLTDHIGRNPLHAEISAIDISADGLSLDAEFYRRNPDVRIEEQSVEIFLFDELTGQSFPLETENLGDGCVRAHLDADPGTVLPVSGDPFRLRYKCSSKYFTDTGFLRFHGIKSGIKYPALLYEDRYIYMEESPLRHPAFFCKDSSLFLSQLAPKGKDLRVQLNTQKIPLKLEASEDDVILSKFSGLFNPATVIDPSGMTEGSEYRVYSLLPAGCGKVTRDVPVLSPNKKVSVLTTEAGVILVITSQTGTLRLIRHNMISQVEEAFSLSGGFRISAVLTGSGRSKPVFSTYELVTTDGEGHVTSVLAASKDVLPSGAIVFETEPGALENVDLDSIPAPRLAVRCYKADGSQVTAPLYCTRKLSEKTGSGSNKVKLTRNPQGKVKLTGSHK